MRTETVGTLCFAHPTKLIVLLSTLVAPHNNKSTHPASGRLTVETLRRQILTLSKNDDRDGNAGAAEKSAADARCHFDAFAPVRWFVPAAAGESRAPVRAKPVAHPVRP